ncbi:MAG: Crp/Fnr family transcriptional regulator [Planctomycetota bacterium]
MTEQLWYLKQCGLFQRLTPQELAPLESQCRTRQFARGAPIYLPADQANGVLLLTTGRAKICSFTEEGKQAILAFIDPGELFGELALFGGGEREEYAEAVEKSTVILMPGDAVNQLVHRHAGLALGVTKLIGLRRKRIERRLKYLLFRSNRERLISLLLELADQYGKPAEDGLRLGIKLSHQDLASIIGSTRETVTVILGELQDEGLLTIGRRRITLISRERLAKASRPPQPAPAPRQEQTTAG